MIQLLDVTKTDKKVDSKTKTVKVKYEKSGLSASESSLLETKILAAFTVKKVFLQMNYSLQNLADDIGSQKHKVSEVLNLNFKMSFYEILNKYRIRESLRLIQLNPNTSIKVLLYDVGYNNRASFYREFKKYTGMTPTAYRRTESLKCVNSN